MRRVLGFGAFMALILGLALGTSGTSVGQEGETGYDDTAVLGEEENLPEGTELFTLNLDEEGGDTFDTNVPPGSFLDVTADGFGPNTKGTIEITSERRTLAFVTADDEGVVRFRVQIPEDMALGDHTLHVVGVDANGDEREVTIGLKIAFVDDSSGWPVWTPGLIAAGLAALAGVSWWQMRGRSDRDAAEEELEAVS